MLTKLQGDEYHCQHKIEEIIEKQENLAKLYDKLNSNLELTDEKLKEVEIKGKKITIESEELRKKHFKV